MPKGQAFDITLLAELKETEVKKESETTTTELMKPAAGKVFRLTQVVLLASAETVVSLEDETTVFGVIPLAAKTTVVLDLATLPQSGYLSTKVINKLKFKTLNTAKFSGSFYGIEDVA